MDRVGGGADWGVGQQHRRRLECVPGVTYRNNVGKRCSGSGQGLSPSSSCAPPACGDTRTAPDGLGRTRPRFDFHLTAELAGHRRRQRAVRARRPTATAGRAPAAPDAGAYEYDSGRPPGPGADPGAACRTQRRRCFASSRCACGRRHLPARAARLPAARPAARRDVAAGPRVGTARSALRADHRPRRVRTLTIPAARRVASAASGRAASREGGTGFGSPPPSVGCARRRVGPASLRVR